MNDFKRREFLKASAAFAAASAAGGFGCVEIASAAPIVPPVVDRVSARVLVDGALNNFLRPSQVKDIKVEPATSISPAYIDRSRLRPLFNYSIFTLVGRLGDTLRFRMDQIVITSFLGLGAVTHYFVGARLVEYLASFMQQMVGVPGCGFSLDYILVSNNSYCPQIVLFSKKFLKCYHFLINLICK